LAAVQEFKGSSSEKQLFSSALSEYAKLQEFVTKVNDLCAGDMSPDPESNIGLVSFLEGVRERTWSEIKGLLSERVYSVLRWIILMPFQGSGDER
jgi:RAD50-interacting protein 1